MIVEWWLKILLVTILMLDVIVGLLWVVLPRPWKRRKTVADNLRSGA